MPKLVAVAVKGEKEVYYLPIPDGVKPIQYADSAPPYGVADVPETAGPIEITKRLYAALTESGDLTSFSHAISSASATEKKRIHVLRKRAADIAGGKVIEILVLLPTEAGPR